MNRFAAVLAACVLMVSTAADAAAGGDGLIRMGIQSHVTPSPNEAVVQATVARLRQAIAPRRLEVRIYQNDELEEAIRRREINIFQCSAGLYRRNISSGVRDLASLVQKGFPDPNQVDGSAFVVLDSRTDLKTLEDCRSKVVVANFEGSFTGWHTALGEIAARGWDPDSFFGDWKFVGAGASLIHAVDALREGRADVAIMRTCYLETLRSQHPEFPALRVLDPKKGDCGPCARSTELYPGWTLATAPGTDPEVTKLVTAAVLTMPATDKGLSWAIATDFSRVDRLLRTLKTGPYAYLRQWTVRRVLEVYWPWLMLALFLVAAMAAHSICAAQLVARRTRQLEQTHHQKMQAEKASRLGLRAVRIASAHGCCQPDEQHVCP